MRHITFLFLFVFTLCHAQCDSVWLFTSFREPSTAGMEYLYSNDCLHWDTIPGVIMKPQIGNDKPYIDAWTGEEKWPNFAPQSKCLRDPSMIQGPDGTYHLVWTTQWTGSKFFGYASSKDLLHWSKQHEIHVMDSIPTNNVWAPELFYDDDLQLYFIIWSSQIPPKDYTDADKLGKNAANRLFYTTTKDFKSFTPAKKYYDPGFNCIDAYLLKRAKKDYVLIVKDNRKPGYSNLFCVFAESPYGPFHDATEKFGRTFSEGPCVVPYKEHWLIYFDQYHPQEYTAVSTYDFKSFTPMKDSVSIPLKHKHGTIIRVPKEKVNRLLAKTRKK